MKDIDLKYISSNYYLPIENYEVLEEDFANFRKINTFLTRHKRGFNVNPQVFVNILITLSNLFTKRFIIKQLLSFKNKDLSLPILVRVGIIEFKDVPKLIDTYDIESFDTDFYKYILEETRIGTLLE